MIHALTQQQDDPRGIERFCRLAGVSRAGYYRHWQASAPRQAETALRDAVQRLSLERCHDGYRRVTVRLREQGWVVNHKRVERLRRGATCCAWVVGPFGRRRRTVGTGSGFMRT